MAPDDILLLSSFWGGFSLAFVILVYVSLLLRSIEIPPKLPIWLRIVVTIPVFLGLFGAAGLAGFIHRMDPGLSNLSAAVFLGGVAYGLLLAWWQFLRKPKHT